VLYIYIIFTSATVKLLHTCNRRRRNHLERVRLDVHGRNQTDTKLI